MALSWDKEMFDKNHDGKLTGSENTNWEIFWFGLDGIGVAQTSPAGFQPTGVPGVDDLLNQAPQQTNAAPTEL